MRPGVTGIIAILLAVLSLIIPVHALTYLESLAVASQDQRPSSTAPTPNIVPYLVGRQTSSDQSNLYTCQNISVNATLEDQSCVVNLVLGLICTPYTRTVTLFDKSCICASAGKLTPKTSTALNTFIRDPANNSTDSPVYILTSLRNGKVAYTADSLLSYLSGTLPKALGTTTTQCSYPTGSLPYCAATDCAYECPSGTKLCGNSCIDNGRSCISNMPARRSLRDLKQVELDFRCPRGKTACALPQPVHGGSVFIADRIECINTMSDNESCGGCAFPLPGRKSGVDCTAIPHAGHVSCRLGVCQLHTCQAGYSLVGSDCIATPSRRSAQKRDAPSQSAGLIDQPLVTAKLETETAPAVALPIQLPTDPVLHADEAKARKAEGKKRLAQRQLTTKQLLDRKEKHAKRKSRWGTIFD